MSGIGPPDLPVPAASEVSVSSSARQPRAQVDHWEWQLRAACRGHPVEIFFSPSGERGPARAGREAAAKAVCHSCPVLRACRAHALRTRELYGVWGGLSGGERERILDEQPPYPEHKQTDSGVRSTLPDNTSSP
jgi:WhiB family redox-sensing transcriptional regulator